ncbi:NADH-quinone oxidoreductase subunit NuoK [Candidatus Purcelliella pentastirinorum]|uniref:NADH-quinone oxidoreductase subunit K n=1 Tax=Candidatus Purcelliella pentastirinorum TaxID=472834 RepID=A0AAX3N7F1_9ENTR|nr:NADH-quinone oxidoreductase subunit NuoK [Candidatus Purcelliella pentastirinorum]WDI78363.1 NADH-quinone oxidoreductase subunit NuoK [Candidatus Purcelliella pentastirinorum]WDR80610.1 NADH-quinone oxidoreductase subunit NuoK [Candidatus Purcelliella pentastirinorum]
MINLKYILIISSILFWMGLITTICRRNIFYILIGIEIMINSSAINFIIADDYWHNIDGQIIYIIIISIAAAEISIGLSLLMIMYNKFKTLDIDCLKELDK